MPKPFDATLKDLAQENPRDYLIEFDGPTALPVSVLNVDLSTVTTAADLVLGLGRPLREAVHLEFHASAAEDLHRDVLAYNALLYRRLKVPVHNLVILLRPKARHPNVDGTVRFEARPGRSKMDFQYEVVQLWQRPVEQLLTGPLGTLPLAPLGQLPAGQSLEDGLQRVIRLMMDRLQREAKPAIARRLQTAAFVLTGLRIELDQAQNLFRRVSAMRESSTYQGILEEGRVEALQETLLIQGRKRFGRPSKADQTSLKAINDVARLKKLVERILEVSSWQDLLGKP